MITRNNHNDVSEETLACWVDFHLKKKKGVTLLKGKLTCQNNT